MHIQELLQIFKNAVRKQSDYLNLTHFELTYIPSEIAQLKNLRRLDISNNNLTFLPPEIGQLQNLERLDLYNNQLNELPPEIAQLENLQRLEVDNNQLKKFNTRNFSSDQTVLEIGTKRDAN